MNTKQQSAQPGEGGNISTTKEVQENAKPTHASASTKNIPY